MFSCFCGCGRVIAPPVVQSTKLTHDEAVKAYVNGSHRGPTPSGQAR
jgi:hypothetical protein